MILRVCVVVPTYNNPRTISKVLKDVVTSTPFPVFVIDDGSETAVENVLYSYEVREALEDGRISVHRFPENCGKGACLRFAVEELVARGFTHMMTMDGDGKHVGSEINKLIKIGKSHPWDLVITNRDAQSGFRLYPLFALQTMKFWTTGYDFEVEVLLRFMMRGISVRKTEIETRKPELTIQPGVWKWLHGRIRYHFLDLLLKTIYLLKSQRSLGQLATGVGVGTFVGCTPFFGFHTLIVAGLAMILPLNFLAMWLGTQVSVVPLAPFVVITSLVIGKAIPGLTDLDGAMAHFYHWLAGSVVLGTLLGLLAAALTYAAGSMYRRSARRLNNTRVSERARGVQISTVKFFLRKFGLGAGHLLTYPAAALAFIFSWTARRALNEFLLIMHPELSRLQRQSLIFSHLRGYFEIRMDSLFNSLGGHSAFEVKASGLEYLTQSQAPLLLSAHLGSVKMLAQLLKLAIEPMHCDRLTNGQTEILPFLGKLAPFDVSVLREAGESGRPVVFAFGFKRDGKYEFIAQAPRQFTFNDKRPREEQILIWSGEFVRELEKLMRNQPGQWFNLFPYWSAVPPNETAQATNRLLEELKLERKRPSDVTSRSIREH